MSNSEFLEELQIIIQSACALTEIKISEIPEVKTYESAADPVDVWT
jgi:hypothetical protein